MLKYFLNLKTEIQRKFLAVAEVLFIRACDSTFEDILAGLNFSALQVWRRYICAVFLVNSLKNKLSRLSVPDTVR
jgi:hypothetical protein